MSHGFAFDFMLGEAIGAGTLLGALLSVQIYDRLRRWRVLRRYSKGRS